MIYSLILFTVLGANPQDGPPKAMDRLELADGTVIIGTLTQLENGIYTIEVEAVGSIHIPLARVSGALVANNASLVTDAGETLTGPLQFIDGSWLVRNALGERNIADAHVVAINPTPVAPPASTQKATITLNGTRTTGNTSTTSASLNMDYTFRYLTHRFNSKLHWAYGEDEEVISKRTTGAEIKYDFFPRDSWYFYTNFSARNDRFADLSLRTTAGIGAGIQILDTDAITWSQESGISALNEDFITAIDESTNTLRVAGDVQWSFGDGRMEAFHDHTLFISLEDPSNLLAEGRLGLRTRIIGGLSLNSQINIRHDSSPPIGVEQDDLEFLLGMGYSTSF
ncbi:MAG: DUF481 domain-containing protein [Planctomycetota bacterium]|nr:DUF481 domain-containing protein [Planctomycetota bacterium]